MGRERLLGLAALLLSSAIFLFVAGRRFWSPGMMYATVADQAAALRYVQLIGETGWQVFFHGEPWTWYHGRNAALLQFPFLLAWPSHALLRAWPIACGLLTLLLSYAAVKRAFGRPAALLAAFLLAVHPTFVIGCKLGNSHVSMMLLFSLGAAWFLMRWWETGRKAFLAAAMASLGVGMGTRLWFAWFAVAVFAGAFFFRAALRRRFPGGSVSSAAWAAGWFALPQLHIAVSELLQGGLARALSNTGTGGAATGALGFAPGRRLAEFHDALRGSIWPDLYLWRDLSGFADNPLYPAFFWAAAAVCARLAWSGDFGAKGPLRWVCSVLPVLLLFGLTSPKVLAWHYFIVYPIPQVLIAVAAVWAASRGRAGRLAAGLGIALLAAGELRSLRSYLGEMDKWGGARWTTDAVYAARDWLAERGLPVLVDDKHILHNLQVVSAGNPPRPPADKLFRLNTGSLKGLEELVAKPEEEFRALLPAYLAGRRGTGGRRPFPGGAAAHAAEDGGHAGAVAGLGRAERPADAAGRGHPRRGRRAGVRDAFAVGLVG
jgi:hypothetical protein